MTNILLTLTLIASIQAVAADLPQPKFEQFYQTQSGARIEAGQAIVSALNGDTVFKCQTVQAKLSKSQTSIGIRAVKKPKGGK